MLYLKDLYLVSHHLFVKGFFSTTRSNASYQYDNISRDYMINISNYDGCMRGLRGVWYLITKPQFLHI